MIDFKKLISTFFAHFFVACLYGSLFGLWLNDQGFTASWLNPIILALSIILVTYVGYKEETKRHYPFAKVVGVNLLGLVLVFVVVALKTEWLFLVAFVITVLAMRYRCNSCVEYKRFPLD